eukprot:8897367-Heterocapsa_arctica.AAC.1
MIEDGLPSLPGHVRVHRQIIRNSRALRICRLSNPRRGTYCRICGCACYTRGNAPLARVGRQG